MVDLLLRPARRPRSWFVVTAITAGFIIEPVVVAAALTWWRAGRLAPSVFFAWEELRAAVFDPFHNPVLSANIVYISFIKGAMDGQLYLYPVQALLLSTVIGVLVGLNVVAWRLTRASGTRKCAAPLSRWGRLVGGGGGGVGVVLGAAAGATGCCGFSVGGGGLLIALGISYTAATAIGERSTALQVIAILILALNVWYTARPRRLAQVTS